MISSHYDVSLSPWTMVEEGEVEELDWAGDRERERSRVEAPRGTRVGRVEGRSLELESILEVGLNTFDCELLL